MAGKTRRKWLADRLVAWLLVLALIPLAAVAVVLHRSYQEAASQVIIERDLQLAYLSASRLRDELLGFVDALNGVARMPQVYGKNAAEQQAALLAASSRLAVFDAGVVLLDNFGQVRATAPERPAMLRSDWSERPFYRRLLAAARFAFSDGHYDEGTRSTTITVAVPVLAEEGEFVGALAGSFRLNAVRSSSLYASIVRLRLGQSGTTYVVDSSGRILYDSDYTRIGANYTAPGFNPGDLPKVGRAERTRDSAGHDVVAAYAPVPGTGWTLITEDDWATVTGATRRYTNTLLVLLVAGAALPTAGFLLLQRQQRRDRTTRERADRAGELSAALHDALLPRHVPLLPGWTVTVGRQPGGEGAADFYDYRLLPDGRLVLAIGSVSRRDVSGALLAGTARAALRAAAHRALPPRDALTWSNELLCPETSAVAPVTATYALLDPSAGLLQVASAGCPSPLHHGGGQWGGLGQASEALGAALTARYEQADVALAPGDCVVFLSPGLGGARNPDGQAFADEALPHVLAAPPEGGQALIDALLAALREFAGPEWTAEHDVTVMVLERSRENA